MIQHLTDKQAEKLGLPGCKNRRGYILVRGKGIYLEKCVLVQHPTKGTVKILSHKDAFAL
jgi:hypothetical protein